MKFIKTVVQKAQKVIFHPHEFFEELKKEQGIKQAFFYFLIITFISQILYTIRFLISVGVDSLDNLPNFFGLIIVSYFIAILMSFVFTLFLFFWIKIWRGKSNYVKTYQLFAYANTPTLFSAIVPFAIINLMIAFYSFWLLIIGTEKIHQMGRIKTIIMYILGYILVALIQFGLETYFPRGASL